MPRQVEGVDRPLGGERVVVEEPIVEVAAEAVDEDDRRAAFALRQIADVPPGDLDRLGGRAAVLVVVLGRHEVGQEIRDEGVDVAVGDALVGDDAEQAADRQHVALLRHMAAQHAGVRRLDRAGDLLGLDVDDLIARRKRIALADQPAGDLALLHGEAPFGHANGADGVAHLLDSMTAFTARCTASASGM